MGLILSSLLSRKMESVLLWVPDSAIAEEMQRTREAKLLQVPFRIADNIEIVSSFQEFERNSWCFHIAVPSRIMEETLSSLAETLPKEEDIIFTLFTKGLLPQKTRRKLGIYSFSSYCYHLAKEYSLNRLAVGVVNGPSLLQEMYEEQHTFLNVGCSNPEIGKFLAEIYQFPFIHTATTEDVASMEMAGVLKNPIAIAIGIASALPNCGSNLQGEMITQGFHEMLRLAEAFGLNSKEFIGRSGLSDLITTAMSKKSRNRNYGRKMVGELMIGPEKLSIKDRIEIWVTPKTFIEREVGRWHDTVEGAYALGILLELAQEKNLNLPLYQTLFEILSRKLPPEALPSLLTGKKSEFPIQKLVGVKKQGMDLAAGKNFQSILEDRIFKDITNSPGFISRIKKQATSNLESLEKRLTRAVRKKQKDEISHIKSEISLWEKFGSCSKDFERIHVRELIRFYVLEIADAYKPTVRESLMRIVAPIRLFSGGMRFGSVTPYLGGEVEQLKKLSAKYNILYAPRHQSHLDSVEMAYALNKLELPIPRYAAGINLMSSPFWEWMLKSLGAYAVDRERTRNSLYLECLTIYSTLLLESGIPSLVYPEGTRSRTGGIVPIKTGILKTAVDAFRNTGSEIIIVPVAISYETVPEDGEFCGDKEKLSMQDFLSRRSNVYLDFCDPIPISEHIGGDDPTLTIGYGIQKGWATYHRILPNQILAKLLVENEFSTSTADLDRLIEEFILSNPGNYLTRNPAEIRQSGIKRLLKRKIILAEAGKITATRKELIQYYANMVPENRSQSF